MGTAVTTITEAHVEQAALDWLADLGWQVERGVDITGDAPGALRDSVSDVVLDAALRDALALLNPELPADALEDARRKLTLPQGTTTEARNRAFHRMLVDGAPVEYRDGEGRVRGDRAQAIDFDSPADNRFLAVNQFTVVENNNRRRLDIALFVNGLPLGVIELKNAADVDATIWTAFNQIQTYKSELPTLFSFNELLIASDGLQARMGTLTAGREWFKPWRTISGEGVEDTGALELEVMLRVLVRRLLRRYGYPPDKQKKATKTVLEQAELVSEVWVSSPERR